MKEARRIFLAVALALGLVLSAGCSKVKDIKVTSCSLESFSPRGLRSVDAVLAIGIDNPSVAFRITSLEGVVKYNGEDFATYTADTVSVDRKSSKVYDVPCSAVLSESVTLMKALSIISNGDLEGFTTDVKAKVKLKGGAGTTLNYKDIDLNEVVSNQ